MDQRVAKSFAQGFMSRCLVYPGISFKLERDWKGLGKFGINAIVELEQIGFPISIRPYAVRPPFPWEHLLPVVNKVVGRHMQDRLFCAKHHDTCEGDSLFLCGRIYVYGTNLCQEAFIAKFEPWMVWMTLFEHGAVSGYGVGAKIIHNTEIVNHVTIIRGDLYLGVYKHLPDFLIRALVVSLMIPLERITAEWIQGEIDRSTGVWGARDSKNNDRFSVYDTIENIRLGKERNTYFVLIVRQIPEGLLIAGNSFLI